MKLQIKVNPDAHHRGCKVKTFGCGSAPSRLPAWPRRGFKGKTNRSGHRDQNTEIVKKCLPPVKIPLPCWPRDAIQGASPDLQKKQPACKPKKPSRRRQSEDREGEAPAEPRLPITSNAMERNLNGPHRGHHHASPPRAIYKAQEMCRPAQPRQPITARVKGRGCSGFSYHGVDSDIDASSVRPLLRVRDVK